MKYIANIMYCLQPQIITLLVPNIMYCLQPQIITLLVLRDNNILLMIFYLFVLLQFYFIDKNKKIQNIPSQHIVH